MDDHTAGTVFARTKATGRKLGVGRIRARGVLPIMAYTERLHPKGVPFSGFRYILKGRDFTS